MWVRLRSLALFTLAFLAAGCDHHCAEARVIEAWISLELEGRDPADAEATYTVWLDGSSDCDVTVEPLGGPAVPLAEADPRRYVATDRGYAASYRIVAGGEEYALPAPPYFTAEVIYTPAEGVVATWSNEYTPAYVIAWDPSNLGYNGTVDGQRATWDPEIFDRPGTWTLFIERDGRGPTDPDTTRIWVSRQLPFTVE